jgi:phosphoglycolate phosphatase
LKLLQHIAPYEHVIWDWNGTIIDDVKFSLGITNEMLKEHSLGPVDLDTHRNLFRMPISEYYEDLGVDFSKHDFPALCNRFVEIYTDRIAEGVGLFAGVRSHLQTISKTKRQSILSAAEQVHLELMTKHFDIFHLFDDVFGITDNLAVSKIDRGRELMAAANLPKSATILIGDTDHDLEVGEALGIDVLLIADGHQAFERLKPLHRHVFNTRYGEIEQPD